MTRVDAPNVQHGSSCPCLHCAQQYRGFIAVAVHALVGSRHSEQLHLDACAYADRMQKASEPVALRFSQEARERNHRQQLWVARYEAYRAGRVARWPKRKQEQGG